MNANEQLKALQQILDTLNLSAARQTDESFRKDGNRIYTTAIQNTKKLMNLLEERILLSNQCVDALVYESQSLGLYNDN